MFIFLEKVNMFSVPNELKVMFIKLLPLLKPVSLFCNVDSKLHFLWYETLNFNITRNVMRKFWLAIKICCLIQSVL